MNAKPRQHFQNSIEFVFLAIFPHNELRIWLEKYLMISSQIFIFTLPLEVFLFLIELRTENSRVNTICFTVLVVKEKGWHQFQES